SPENVGQLKVCQCGSGDSNFQITNKSDGGENSPTTCPNCQVLKSGNLLLSSKGIGWTVWKKRWFILTRTSLVFFRSDPNVPPPRGSEPIVTLGGIDLNNTASMIVKEERKLITVVFPDGRDGRTFTLKAETTEDLNEWRSALENALAQAPSVVNTAGQLPVVSTDITEPVEAAVEQSENKSVIGRPAEFALVDADGTTAFLQKALKFIEDYGVKVEGILRQSADVEEVKRRVQDYEKGKNEFSPEEDAHVIGDCIKCILREMPSSPIPAPCCTALVRAYRTDKTKRLDAMNRVIYEVFPEPNRQLLQRILKMMQIVGSHKAVNRMSSSALAACMAPLLLRPLLLGECEIDSEFSMAGDGSFQLLQAAAAANHAQAIVIIMLEEYDQIFDDIEDGSYSSDAYTESDIDKEYSTDNDIPEDYDGSSGSGEDVEEDLNDDTEHSYGMKVECDSNIRIDNANDKDISFLVNLYRYLVFIMLFIILNYLLQMMIMNSGFLMNWCSHWNTHHTVLLDYMGQGPLHILFTLKSKIKGLTFFLIIWNMIIGLGILPQQAYFSWRGQSMQKHKRPEDGLFLKIGGFLTAHIDKAAAVDHPIIEQEVEQVQTIVDKIQEEDIDKIRRGFFWRGRKNAMGGHCAEAIKDNLWINDIPGSLSIDLKSEWWHQANEAIQGISVIKRLANRGGWLYKHLKDRNTSQL
ncbi:hypothetical protein ACJX0J_006242, partial [Zea mays]